MPDGAGTEQYREVVRRVMARFAESSAGSFDSSSVAAIADL